ncbi:MAG: hypothetical protein IIC82_04630 [Chloroflexi bacterium]|nr:hypothetical protein [Chloroflexota bacterium]
MEQVDGPHQCWPSRMAYIVIGCLLALSIIMHSFYLTERDETLSTQFMERIDTQMETRFKSVLTSFEDTMQQTLETLTRAEHFVWAVTTPAMERDVKLRQMIETLQGGRDMQLRRMLDALGD